MATTLGTARRNSTLAVLAACFAFVAASCGGSDDASSPGPTGSGGTAGAQPDASDDTSAGDALPDTQPGDTGPDEPVFPADHPRILFDSEVRASLAQKLSESHPAAARFKEMVDNQLGGADYYEFQAWNAALLYQLSGEAAYADYAIQLVDTHVAAEEALIEGGERAEVAFDSYLYVGETIGDLALTYDWCFDRLTPQQKSRWIAYADQAVSNVWNPEGATWGGASYPWSGWSIDNPSNNYYYSFLRATMLLGLATKGESALADGWVTKFRTDKIGAQLVPTFQSDLVGGGSREGTGYGVSMARLFELYYLWEHSTGERIADLSPHALQSLLYLIHETVPTLDRVAPIGDHARDSTAALFDYHRNYGLTLVKLFGSSPESEVGQSWLSQCSVPEMGSAFMFSNDFVFAAPEVASRPLAELTPAWHAPGTGHMFFRSSWDTSASWLSFICGPYTESHAHHDQGSLLLYKNEWLAFDENVLSHSGIRQEEELHNLVRLEQGGETIAMHEGAGPAELLALQRRDRFVHLATDLTPAFDGHPAVQRLQRELVYLPPNAVVVFDRISANSPLDAVWQLNTPAPVTTGVDGTARANGTQSTLEILPVFWSASDGPSLVDWQAVDSDMSGGTRIEYTQSVSGADSFFLTVLSLDGGVVTVSERPPTTSRGVRVDFVGGEYALVDFELSAAGGALSLFDAQGQEQVSAPLVLGVETLPPFAP